MSIDMAARKAGIELERDVPRKDQRSTRHIAKLIGECRKLEAHMASEDRETHRKLDELSMRVVELTTENAALRRENDMFRLRERLREIEVSREDTRFLLTGEKAAG